MKIVGLITEYNPFHLGHLYHLIMSKELTGADYTIVIMSGSFVQRGEPSIVDKWTKAKIAVDNGADLVIEFPFIFATQTAELFAYGAIKLLDSLNIIDYIVFGSEIGSIDPLERIAQILVDEPILYRQELKANLNDGESFAISRSNALKKYFSMDNSMRELKVDIESLLKMSNNILAIEYLKALQALNSGIKPITFKRIGSSYTSTHLDYGFASATSIRESIINNGLESVKQHLPEYSYFRLMDYRDSFKKFNELKNYNSIINYLLKIDARKNIVDTMDIDISLKNRIINCSPKCEDIEDLIQKVSTKRYTKTRIQRILIHLMCNLTNSIFKELYEIYPSYIRVLGSNYNGFSLLNKIKRNSPVPIITKFADYKEYNCPYLNKSLHFDKKSTDLFFLGLNNNAAMNMDYYMTPYIKKQ